MLMQWLCVTQVKSQPLDDVVEYFSGIDQDLSRPGEEEGGTAVFKPGWEVCPIACLANLLSKHFHCGHVQ